MCVLTYKECILGHIIRGYVLSPTASH